MGLYELKQELAAWQERASAVLDSFDLGKLQGEIAELESQMQAPDFWGDSKKAQKVSQQAASKNKEVEQVLILKRLTESLPEVLAMAEADESLLTDAETEIAKAEEPLAALELKTFFSGELDQNNVILSFHAGAGGVDAMDWAESLLRMYVRFAEDKQWKTEVLDISHGEEAGIKSATLRIEGEYAYGMLKGEAGVHRLVRISPFDSEGMRHTSFAAVEVIPELNEVNEAQVEIDPKDLRVDTFLSSGKGGQSVNTTYSAVRITHIPTNIVVSCQNERSQQQNRETAMSVLKSRLYQILLAEHKERIDELRGVRKSIEWGSQIRSYVMQPYQLVKDHRTEVETANVEGVLDGDIGLFIDGYLRFQAAKAK